MVGNTRTYSRSEASILRSALFEKMPCDAIAPTLLSFVGRVCVRERLSDRERESE